MDTPAEPTPPRPRLGEPGDTGSPAHPGASGTRLLDPHDSDADGVFPATGGIPRPDERSARRPARFAGLTRLRLVAVLLAVVALAVAGFMIARPDDDPAPASTATPTGGPATAGAEGARPAGDGYEVGIRFSVASAGTVSGLRLAPKSKPGARVVVHLWSGEGKLLGRGVASAAAVRDGWLPATFEKPVALEPGKTYVASYYDASLAKPPASRDAVKRTQRVKVLGAVQRRGAGFPSTAVDGDLAVDLRWAPGAAPAPSAGASGKPGAPPDGTFPGGGGTGCAAQPSSCGFPDASNTGPKAGVKLKSSGSVNASRKGQVVEGLDITGEINVTADNVIIRNVRVTGGGDWVVIVRPGADNLRIEDSELRTPPGTPQDIACVLNIGDSKPTILRADIHSCSAGVSSGGGIVKDSYIHDMSQKPGLSHDVGVASNGTGGMQVIHNTIFNQLDQTAAVAFYQDFDVQRNNLVKDNLLAGGGYCVYGGKGDKGQTSNIRFVNNRFSRKFNSNCGHFGVVASFDVNDPGNEWTGNRWDDTLAAINM